MQRVRRESERKPGRKTGSKRRVALRKADSGGTRPSHLVRPYARRNKTDRTHAVALVEACRHGQIRPVPVKTPE